MMPDRAEILWEERRLGAAVAIEFGRPDIEAAQALGEMMRNPHHCYPAAHPIGVGQIVEQLGGRAGERDLDMG